MTEIKGKYIPGSGSYSAKLMVVTGAPGWYETFNQDPKILIGPPGKLFDAICNDAGIYRSDIYITSVIKYRPPDNNLKRLSEIGITSIEDQCVPQLLDEIRTIKPNAILALDNTVLGDIVLQTLTGNKGVSKWRGSILRSNRNIGNVKIIPSYHPVNLLSSKEQMQKLSWSAKVYITMDYKRALEESKTDFFNLPTRNLEICRSSHQLYQFLERYSNRTQYPKVSVDIEVIKCIPVCVSLAFTPSHAISVPLINIGDGVAGNIQIPEGELARIWRFLAELFDSEVKIVGQNFKFDHEKLRNVCGFKIRNVYSDVMFKAHCLHAELPKSLGFTTSIYTREPYYKDEGKEFNYKKDNLDKFYIYNAKDAAVTLEIDDQMEKSIDKLNLRSFYYDHMMKLHDVYMDIESVGFRVDIGKRKELIEKYDKWAKEVQIRLDLLAGRSVNVNSPKQIAKLLYEDLEIPTRADVGEDTLCALLANTVKDERKKQIIEDIYIQRRIHRAKKAINAKLDYDNRMRTSINIVGTETGRRTTGILDPPVRPDKIGFPFQLIAKHGDYGTDMRYMFIPDEGMIFQNFDLSQAEARIVALLCEDEEMLKSFDTIDIHALTASWVFGGKYEDHCKVAGVEPPTRFGGKTIRHAGNYNMGKHRLMLDVTAKARRFHINISISEKDADKHLGTFHRKSPKIRGKFHDDIRKALVDNKRVLINPYGRRRIFLGMMGEDLYREGYAQIPQSTVGDHTAGAIIRIKKRLPELQIIVESHDAILVQNLEKDSDEVREIVQEEFERPIDFSRCSLPRGILKIPSDCEVGYNYKDLKKYRKAS